MAGFEPAPQGLEGPQATLPHIRSGSAYGMEPVPPRWQRGMHLHTEAEHGPVLLTGPSTVRRLSKTPLLRALGGKGFEPNCSPWGERGYGPSADHPLVPPDVCSRLDQSRRQTLP